MKTTRLIISFVVCMGGTAALAQQVPLYTNYMYNTLAVNPAYAGSRDALTMTALGRFQWVGFKGAPMTQTFTAHTPISSKNIGLGLSMMNDKAGPVNNTSFSVDFAYRLKVGKKARLSFGLKGGMTDFNAGLSRVVTHDDNDATFANSIRNKILPNIGAGVYFQSDYFYAGLSVPQIVQNNIYPTSISSAVGISKQVRNYYFIMGAVIPLNPQLKFKPTVLAKATAGAPMQADFTANFIINDVVTIGGMYRTGDALGVLFGVNLTEQFALGYSFDWSTVNRTGRYNAGSHELMLRYDFVYEKERRIKSPRYF